MEVQSEGRTRTRSVVLDKTESQQGIDHRTAVMVTVLQRSSPYGDGLRSTADSLIESQLLQATGRPKLRPLRARARFTRQEIGRDDDLRGLQGRIAAIKWHLGPLIQHSEFSEEEHYKVSPKSCL